MNLDELKKEESFNVPDEYFETLQREVMSKIRQEKKFTRNKKLIFSVSSVAASVLIVIGILSLLPRSGDVDMAAATDTIQNVKNQENIESKAAEIHLAKAPAKKDKEIRKAQVKQQDREAGVLQQPVPVEESEGEGISIIDYYQEELANSDYLEI